MRNAMIVKPTSNEKVNLYSKTNFEGNVYAVGYGNYAGADFVNRISPDNVFSLTLPPYSTIKLFCGNSFDNDNIGSTQITNATRQTAKIPFLPEHLQGRIRSLVIERHTDKADNISTILRPDGLLRRSNTKHGKKYNDYYDAMYNAIYNDEDYGYPIHNLSLIHI